MNEAYKAEAGDAAVWDEVAAEAPTMEELRYLEQDFGSWLEAADSRERFRSLAEGSADYGQDTGYGRLLTRALEEVAAFDASIGGEGLLATGTVFKPYWEQYHALPEKPEEKAG